MVPRLDALLTCLRHVRGNLRYVSYQEAEQGCELLAEQLLQEYSQRELESFSFLAVPRGGMLVLGMLAYVLNLAPDQLVEADDPSTPTVVVDDCALTGVRFGQMLSRIASDHVVFAHLYSCPELRRAITVTEPRVKFCIAAHDLSDHALDLFGDPAEYRAWRRLWEERLGSTRYWLGQPDVVCFPWSEPDRPFWNPSSRNVESAWRFLPPHMCLKNKAELGLPPRSVSGRAWQVPTKLVVGQFDSVLWLCRLDTQQVYALDGTAADMWRALAVYGDLTTAAEYLLECYDVDKQQLDRDIAEFIEQLLAKGLLEPVG